MQKPPANSNYADLTDELFSLDLNTTQPDLADRMQVVQLCQQPFGASHYGVAGASMVSGRINVVRSGYSLPVEFNFTVEVLLVFGGLSVVGEQPALVATFMAISPANETSIIIPDLVQPQPAYGAAMTAVYVGDQGPETNFTGDEQGLVLNNALFLFGGQSYLSTTLNLDTFFRIGIGT